MLPTQTRIVAAISLASLLGPGSCWIRPLQSPLQQAATARRPLTVRVSQEAADLDAPVLDAPSPVLESAVTPASRPKGFQDAAKRAKTGTVNKRLLSAIDAELKDVQQKKGPDPLTAEEPDTDLNGINPIQPFGSSLFAAMVSLLFWRITIGLSVALNKVHLDTDFYPAQRLFSIASTSFVGIMALGAGVIGVTALGLLGLALRVSIGILSGELDPNKKKEEAAPKSPIPLDAKGLPKITGAWYDIKPDNKDLNTRRD